MGKWKFLYGGGEREGEKRGVNVGVIGRGGDILALRGEGEGSFCEGKRESTYYVRKREEDYWVGVRDEGGR